MKSILLALMLSISCGLMAQTEKELLNSVERGWKETKQFADSAKCMGSSPTNIVYLAKGMFWDITFEGYDVSSVTIENYNRCIGKTFDGLRGNQFSVYYEKNKMKLIKN